MPFGEAIARIVLWGGCLIVVIGVGLLLGWAAACIVGRMVRNSSEFTMQSHVFWLFQSVWMMSLSIGSSGAKALAYLAAFLAYRIALRAMAPSGNASELSLLLRVFGQRTTPQQLAKGLLVEWRHDGPVMAIGSGDLALETLDAPELVAHLEGRTEQLFIGSPDDLTANLDRVRHRQIDGLFPLLDFYCRDNSWRPTVLTLMSRAQRVLVDMRGFDEERQGIQYEIKALSMRVPAASITIIVDEDKQQQVLDLFRRTWSDLENGGSGKIGVMKKRTGVF